MTPFNVTPNPPALLEHVKSEVGRDAELAKNLRKAREEREALRKGK